MSILNGSDCVEISVNETPICALCGPVIRDGAGYDGGAIVRRTIIADEDQLPVVIGQSVDIDGEIWEVDASTIFGGVVSVKFIRNAG